MALLFAVSPRKARLWRRGETMRVQIGAIVPHRKKRRDKSNDRRRERQSDKHSCDCADADDYFRLGLHFCLLSRYGHLGTIKSHCSPVQIGLSCLRDCQPPAIIPTASRATERVYLAKVRIGISSNRESYIWVWAYTVEGPILAWIPAEVFGPNC